MVDPPLNSRSILHVSGVPSRLVDSVIITHCHADHDQGRISTFCIILCERFQTAVTQFAIVHTRWYKISHIYVSFSLRYWYYFVGTLQKILEENQVTLITTSTIMGSFLRKYSPLTGLSEDSLRRLFVFRPVLLGEPMRVNGGEFRFFYSIHTIPCIGFEVYYGGKEISSHVMSIFPWNACAFIWEANFGKTDITWVLVTVLRVF